MKSLSFETNLPVNDLIHPSDEKTSPVFLRILRWYVLCNQVARSVLLQERQTDWRSPLTILVDMLDAGFKVDEEAFLQNVLLSYRAQKLRELETKSRIIVEKATSLMGVLDEEASLGYGEIFIQLRDPQSLECQVVTGPVAVTKNPCFHPGDVRLLQVHVLHGKKFMESCITTRRVVNWLVMY